MGSIYNKIINKNLTEKASELNLQALDQLGITSEITEHNRAGRIEQTANALFSQQRHVHHRTLKKYTRKDHLQAIRYLSLFLLYTNEHRLIDVPKKVRQGYIVPPKETISEESIIPGAKDEFSTFLKTIQIGEKLEKKTKTSKTAWKNDVKILERNIRKILDRNLTPVEREALAKPIDKALSVLKSLY